jgi:hypothetical protein
MPETMFHTHTKPKAKLVLQISILKLSDSSQEDRRFWTEQQQPLPEFNLLSLFSCEVEGHLLCSIYYNGPTSVTGDPIFLTYPTELSLPSPKDTNRSHYQNSVLKCFYITRWWIKSGNYNNSERYTS